MSQPCARLVGQLGPRPLPQCHLTPWRSLVLLILATIAALGIVASTASAQPGGPPWIVGIDPSASAQTSQTLSVTVRWCDKNFPLSSSRTIRFKGQDVTSQFSFTNHGFGIHACAANYGGTAVYGASSTGTVTLTGGETADTLYASNYNANGTLLSGTKGWMMATYHVAVTPHGAPVTPAPNAVSVSQPFTITNVGNSTATYSLQATCSGAVSGCSSPTSVTLWPGEAWKQTVTVTYNTGAAEAKGTVELRATYGAFTDVGTVYATMTAPSTANTRVLVNEINPGTSIDRASCLVFSLMPDLASECGVLRVTHALPSVRTLNKVRAPTLVYYGDHVYPTPLAAHVILADTATIPDEVQLYVLDANGGILGQPRSYAGSAWAASRAQRIAVPLWLSGPTRIVPYQVDVKLRYGANWRPAAPVVTGELAFVNRLESRFGAGWWLAGLEQVFPGQPGGAVLWVGGDGSTRKYVSAGTIGTDTVYVTESLRRPDTLRRQATGFYRRSLPNGTSILFDVATGLHKQTVNRLGHTTLFTWGTVTGEPRLDAIEVPSGSTARSYTFQYDAGGRLERVVAPGGGGIAPREVSLRRKLINGQPSRGVDRITDPDGKFVEFQFQAWAPDFAYGARIDRRGTQTDVYNEPGSPTIAYASTPTGSGETVRQDFRTVTGIGSSGGESAPTPVDSVYFRHDGPRTDSADITKIWTDRFGAPRKIVNAHGRTVTVRRDDWRFPATVTRVEYPVLADGRQRVQTSTFDGGGSIKTSTEVNPYGDDGSNRDAVTRYEYGNPSWPTFVTRIVPPQRDSIMIEYDVYGNRTSQRDARGDSTRVFFNYGNSWKLLSSIVVPGSAKDSLRYSSTLGNLSWTQSPGLDTTSYSHDLAGRDTMVVTPFDSARTRFTRVRTVYNVVDQVDTVITTGDAIGTYPTKHAYVANTYDEEGNLKSVGRWSIPDIPLTNGRTNTIGQVITRWDYDRLHRKTREYAPDGTPTNPADNPFDETRYDLAGNVDTVVTRRNDVLTMSYDALNRLKVSRVPQVMYPSRQGVIHQYAFTVENPYGDERTTPYPRYPNDPNNPNGFTIFKDSSVFTYDELGNVTRADNRDALVRRGYYLNGLIRGDTVKIRTLAELSAGGDTTSHVYALAYKYDLNGRRVDLTHPSQLAPQPWQNTTQYTYDVGGNFATVKDPLGYVYRFQYTARGQLRNKALLNGTSLSETYTYDPEGNLTSDVISGSASRNATYSYYPGGKVKDARNSTGIKDTTWAAYSGLGHLGEGAQKSHGAYNSASSQGGNNFGIDALGNVYQALTWSAYRDRNSTATHTGLEERGYQHGTGRLAWSNPVDLNGGIIWERDIPEYDAAGNVAFETTVPYNAQPDDSNIEIHDRASYYGANGQLRASDWRSQHFGLNWFQTAFEEYRYDALGRRVLVHARRYCQGPVMGDCRLDWVRRTVWDGSSELYEIQMPLSHAENDVNQIDLPLESSPWGFGNWDPNPFFGRVVYTHALGIDQPQSIIRMGYRTRLDTTRAHPLPGLLDFDAIPIVPLWDARGQPDIGVFAHRGAWDVGSPGTELEFAL